jgi:hypothetical protein
VAVVFYGSNLNNQMKTIIYSYVNFFSRYNSSDNKVSGVVTDESKSTHPAIL